MKPDQTTGDQTTGDDAPKLDATTVTSLYAEHSEALTRFLIGLLRDSQLAHDVLQSTFTKLVERGHETQKETRKAWLFRVAYHEAMLVRRRQATGDKAVRGLGWIKELTGESADKPILRFEAVQKVRSQIEQLPAPQRRIVKMRVYEEKTFATIADELGIPLGTALGRMRSALKKLRQVLDDRQAS